MTMNSVINEIKERGHVILWDSLRLEVLIKKKRFGLFLMKLFYKKDDSIKKFPKILLWFLEIDSDGYSI